MPCAQAGRGPTTTAQWQKGKTQTIVNIYLLLTGVICYTYIGVKFLKGGVYGLFLKNGFGL